MEGPGLHDDGQVLALAGQELELPDRVAVDDEDVGEGPGATTPSFPGMRTISAPTSVACRMISIGDSTSRRSRNSRLWSTCSCAEEIAAVADLDACALADLERLQPAVDHESFFASISGVMPNSFARSFIA